MSAQDRFRDIFAERAMMGGMQIGGCDPVGGAKKKKGKGKGKGTKAKRTGNAWSQYITAVYNQQKQLNPNLSLSDVMRNPQVKANYCAMYPKGNACVAPIYPQYAQYPPQYMPQQNILPGQFKL